MTQTIGWWDYDESDRPTLINRDSGERLRKSRKAWMWSKQWSQTWVRFDYLHNDLQFPILVCWMPDRGHVVVDYVASAAVWRKESGRNQSYPPYGHWVRVDDCLVDALWCWPGILERFAERGGHHGVVGLIGGWCNGSWNPKFFRVSLAKRGLPEQAVRIAQEGEDRFLPPKLLGRLDHLTPLDEPAPSPWEFIYARNADEQRSLGYDEFQGFKIAPKPTASEPGGQDAYRLPSGFPSIEINGVLPQLRTRDRSKVFFPTEARLHTYKHAKEPNWSSISFACLEAGMIGVKGAWSMGPYIESSSVSRVAHAKLRYGWLHSQSGASLSSYKIIDKIALDLDSPLHGASYSKIPAPWALSAITRRRMSRLLLDALLAWTGTDDRPLPWAVVPKEVLSYHQNKIVGHESTLLGGWPLGYEVFASITGDQIWTRGGFRLSPFGGKK